MRRSVANHLNDLSRQQPELAVAATAAWLAEPDENTARLVRHALRTLVKRGHPGALAQLGFHTADVTVAGPVLAETNVPFGGTVNFTASIRNNARTTTRLVVDFVVHHQKANGALSGKTFKLTTLSLEPGEVVLLAKGHSLRAITTRRYYPGEHAIELQVNGAPSGRTPFTLLPEA